MIGAPDTDCASKNAVPSVRSASSINPAEVNTGTANACRNDVMKSAQTVSGRRNIDSPGARRLTIVVM